jgi:hypothetical protein
MSMSAEQLAAIAGVILSLLFSYVPGLSNWYGGLDSVKKSLFMAGMLVIVAVAVFGLSCWNVIAYVTCDRSGALGLLGVLIAALIANQSTYLLSPQKARAARQ